METWQEHRKILKALARHAAGPAQKAMRQHIRAAASRTGIAFATLGDWPSGRKPNGSIEKHNCLRLPVPEKPGYDVGHFFASERGDYP